MSSIIKSPFIHYHANNKKIIEVNKDKYCNVEKKELEPNNEKNNEKIKSLILKAEQEAKIISDDIINKAVGEANCIVEEANNKAIEIVKQAYDKSVEDGYQEGLLKGEKEALHLTQEAELIVQKAYSEKNEILAEIEPKMIMIIKSIVKNLTNYVIDKEDIIIYLIRKGFSEVEILDNVTVHVSPDDFDYVNENKDMLYEDISNQVIIEIIKDKSLKSNDCLIETKLGNIDCSLSTRLDGLNSDLELIAKS
ncbi:MAG: FliH/SctL family protein [Vallitalea sp.]|nr:FliH/SctL family protein [Vallitalea sp.]